ncbi:enoyl-CoA hydratase [Mesorhizobium sp. WSM2239]|uniref:Enoyl-CoA hydratase n=2 Tax=unclassified Mesorhizobium TaxID=325217 RepID=A0AAU8DK01_9HYPH
MTSQEAAGGDSAEILIDTAGAVATVTLNRPKARNALTFEMYDGLAAFCRGVDPDGPIKAVIVTGAGERAFAAGTDIAQFRDFRSEKDALAYEERVEGVLSAIETCPVPTIAAIAGACTGGGAGIATACDLRIAARNAKFGFPIAKTLGNCLSIENYARLAALIGAGRVIEMIFTARLLEAEEARAAGLVSEVLDDHQALMARASELARTLAGHAPLTLRATKEALRRIRHGRADGDDLVAMCYTSADFREGVEAFLEKRPAEWKGR